MSASELKDHAIERERNFASTALVLTTIYGLFLIALIAMNASWV
ncbi:MAG: hypothetical protein AAFR91_06880 [Pseudomonadota bacterium]